jgi:hypothetical protein
MRTFQKSLAMVAASVALGAAAHGQTLITDFNDFFSNELYASWAEPSAVIVSGPDSYSVTATGYGSNYKFIGNLGILGSGNTHLELEVALSGPPAADGQLGPIISLVDSDGSHYNYAWYGQPLGDHVLTAPIDSPTWVSAPGAVPGLDLDALLHMHLQLDPAQFGSSGAYTVEWKNLNLIFVEGLAGDFDDDSDVDGNDILVWQRDSSVGALADWRANFGMTTGGAAAAVRAIPEPAALGLVILGALIAASGSRRRRQ